MALNSEIPKNSRLAIIGGKFKAVLNNPTIGKYDFINYRVGGDRYNARVDLGLDMNPEYLYFFNQLNFSLSMADDVYLKSIDASNIPEISIKDSSSSKNIFSHPFRLFRYFENSDIDFYHLNANKNSRIIADFQCVLIQVPELVGISDVYAQVAMSVYEISDHNFIRSIRNYGKV